MSLTPGTRLGPYEITARLGAGGMGEVYKARDIRLNRVVAIKVSAARFTSRFEREAKAVASLNHPYICTLFDVGPDYIVMEYIDGKPLKGPLPLDAALRYARAIAEALDAAHRRGIVHRDLKPDNILVTKTGIKLLDFGLAKIAPSDAAAAERDSIQTLTMAGTIVGTPQYMAPEQIWGNPADARTDIFAFGAVLYELLTGKCAFEGATRESLLAAIVEREPPPIPGAPPAVEYVVKRCLAKEPDDRWQSARDLAAVLEMQSVSAGKSSQKLAALKPLLIVLCALVAGLLLIVFWRAIR